MGYYSKVSILCGRNVAERLVKLPTLFGCKIHKRGDGLFRFVWESVKWYDGDFPEVDAVKDAIGEWLDKFWGPDGPDKPDFCSFIRIGEEEGDYEYDKNSLYWEKQWPQMDVFIREDEPKPINVGQSEAGKLIAENFW